LDLLLVLIGAAIVLAGCIVYIGYRVWQEAALEMSYQKQYGADWQVQYERYHGTLAHAHSRLLIASLGLVALCAIFGWLLRKWFKSRHLGRHSHESH
jgi:hypothetical protein